jgi:three-Cys-motif partner protein
MGHKHHTWSLGAPPPQIRPHSLAKHRLLAAYLRQYVAVLTPRLEQDRLRLTLVDGFAGGGQYLDPSGAIHRGSPLIMLDAMRDAAIAAQACREKQFNLDVNYFFIEQESDAFAFLKHTLQESEYRHLIDDKIHLIRDDFVSRVPEILSFIKRQGRAGRSIFALDQFGYLDVPLPTIRTILSELANAEIILTFAVDFLINYLTTNEQTLERLAKLDIALPRELIRTAKEEIGWRRKIQFVLHQEIPFKTGAKYYTPFFIRSPDSNRDFWLIHLSGHFRARDVMVGLHWEENTSFAHYGRSGFQMLGYDQETDVSLIDQTFLPGFFFDETAAKASNECISQQLPRKIHQFSGGITFNDFYAAVTNESPVTAEMMRIAIGEVAGQGELRVRDKFGKLRSSGKVKSGSDIILPSQQRRLFLPSDLT